MGLYSLIVRLFVCFHHNKSTLRDYANCTANVSTCSARRLWASGPSLSMCHISVIHPLSVFTKVGAHGNKPLVEE